MTIPYKVKIRWGSPQTQSEVYEDQGNEPSEYEFETKDELDAFLQGAEAASGWMDYTIVECVACERERREGVST